MLEIFSKFVAKTRPLVPGMFRGALMIEGRHAYMVLRWHLKRLYQWILSELDKINAGVFFRGFGGSRKFT